MDGATQTPHRWWRDPGLGLSVIRDRLRSSLWPAPLIAIAAAIGGAVGLVTLDQRLGMRGDAWYLYGGGPESAQRLLSAITTSMLTFTAVVFSITVLVLQLGSSQFSPRVIRTFLKEPMTKAAMAIFVGTFVYAFVVLSQVRSAPDPFVPAIATWFAFGMVLVSVIVFVHYIHRMAHAIRVISVVTKIADETRTALERMCPRPLAEPAAPEPAGPDTPPDQVLSHMAAPGVVAFVDTEALISIARAGDAVIEVVPQVGQFVVTGAPLLRIWGGGVNAERASAAVALELERTGSQDPAFGFRQLVDIAVRALSPGVNDPGTAVQVLDHLHDLVRRLTERAFPPRVRLDETGARRLIVSQPDYADYVSLAFEEIRQYGASSPQVRRRMRAALEDCVAIAARARRGILTEQLILLEQAGRAEPRVGLPRQRA